MKEERKSIILMLGTTDFPFGMAGVEKQMLIAKSLIKEGCKVVFICRKSFNENNHLPYKGEYEGISYIYTSLVSRRLKNGLVNRLSWIVGSFLEKLYLLFADYSFAISNTRIYRDIYWYSRLLNLRRKKFYLTHVEDASSITSGKDRRTVKQLEKFEEKTWQIVDGVFPISEELGRQVLERNPSLPQLKIPVIVDINDMDHAVYDEPIDGRYFMFCGDTVYKETIFLIIEAFEKSNCSAKLLLVISAKDNRNKKEISERISCSACSESIVVKSYLPKGNLWGYYKNSLALLIPLNFDQRDKARFPHKIGEYCAAAKPIITSNWGEIPYYFEDYKNALVLSSSDSSVMGKRMFEIEMDHELAESLGTKAYETALKQFSYELYGKRILNFHVQNLES